MRRLLVLSCRAFPRDHRARRSDEVVDTALLAADGSRVGVAREALSLVSAGMRQRLRAESERPLRDGLAPLAWVIATVNFAVAIAGAAAVNPPILPFASRTFPPYTYRPDWWWIAFMVTAAGVVFGLWRGDRRLALGAALANFGLLAYDAVFPATGQFSHLLVLLWWAPSFPAGREWLMPAGVLALAVAGAPLRRLPWRRLPLSLVAALALVVLSRESWTWGHFLFLRWPLAAVLVLAFAFGALVPRLAVLATGLVVAVLPSGATLLAGTRLSHPSLVAFAAAGVALVPFARLVRRRLT